MFKFNFFRSCFAFISCFFILFSSSMPSSALDFGDTPFEDVTSSYWAYNPIMTLKRQGILYGYDDGTFKPNSSVTYAQFSAFLSRAFYSSDIIPSIDGSSDWSSPYLQVMTEHNILYKQTSVDYLSRKANEAVCVYDFAQMMYDVLVDYHIFEPSHVPYIPSLDELNLLDSVPYEYRNAVSATYSLGLLNDIFDFFLPDNTSVSRAQACVSINLLSQYITPNDETPISGLIIGGQITVSDVSAQSAEISLVNNGTATFSHSGILALKRYENGIWVELPFHSSGGTVSEVTILRQLPPNQEKNFLFDIDFYYGSLSPGLYQLEMKLTQNNQEYILFDIFSIP